MIKGDKVFSEVVYPSAARLRSIGSERLVRLADKRMKLLVKPSRPRWKSIKTFVTQSPIPIPVSWQRLIDAKYWSTELDDDN